MEKATRVTARVSISQLTTYVFSAIEFCRTLPPTDDRRLLNDDELERFGRLNLSDRETIAKLIEKCLLSAKDQFPNITLKRDTRFDHFGYLKLNYPNFEEIKHIRTHV